MTSCMAYSLKIINNCLVELRTNKTNLKDTILHSNKFLLLITKSLATMMSTCCFESLGCHQMVLLQSQTDKTFTTKLENTKQNKTTVLIFWTSHYPSLTYPENPMMSNNPWFEIILQGLDTLDANKFLNYTENIFKTKIVKIENKIAFKLGLLIYIYQDRSIIIVIISSKCLIITKYCYYC